MTGRLEPEGKRPQLSLGQSPYFLMFGSRMGKEAGATAMVGTADLVFYAKDPS